MSRILVTGGAGYIGSHVVQHLLALGQDVLVLDDLSSGFAAAVPEDILIRGDVGDPGLLDEILGSGRITAVMHFAARIDVAESVTAPSGFYLNNVAKTLVLLDAMVRHGIEYFVFSSTAAVFGLPQQLPIDEKHPRQPVNPYGRGKWLIEQALEDYASAYNLKYGCLRYFNAAGADPEGRLGERHDPETHLIPRLLQLASGRLPHFTLFGDDYPTSDGSCIRDYVHVLDLADAHWKLLGYLRQTRESAAFNLGNGAGFSNRQVIEAVRAVTGKELKVQLGPRRAGDPPILVADSRLARTRLGWQPNYADLSQMVEHAWNWERKKGVLW